MAGPSDKIIDIVMKDGTPKPTELKLSPPKAFTGKRDEFDRFWQDVILLGTERQNLQYRQKEDCLHPLLYE